MTMNGRQNDAVRSNIALSAPTQHNVPRAKSPSHAAALAATARAGAGTARADESPMSKKYPTQPLVKLQTKPPVALKPRTLSVQSRSNSTTTIDTPTDTTSIAPTTSLVSLFEQKSTTATKVPPAPLVTKPTASPVILSPRPLRSPDGSRSILQSEMGFAQRVSTLPHVPREETSGKQDFMVAPVQTDESRANGEDRPSTDKSSSSRGKPQLKGSIPTEHNANIQRDDSGARTETRDPYRQVRTTTDSQDRGRQGTKDGLVRTAAQEDLMRGTKTSSVTASPLRRDAPALPPRQSMAKTQRSETFTAQLPTRDMPRPISRTPTEPIDIRSASRSMPPQRDHSTSARSARSVNATYRQLYPKNQTLLTKDDELANAIVASSLASSRLTSPQRLGAPPPPPSRRHSRHGHSIFHSRTPSPTKGGGLRQTLRKQDSSSSDEEDDTHPYSKHRKRRLIRKHPNKHHEGDRKRWRDAVTESERRRYEGVWAANKGLHVSNVPHDVSNRGDDSSISNECVSAIVTRDIWERSRLPDFELEAVWDLVDSDGAGRLSKEQFVIGMWLIDQRLKGRKLPVKVTPTVWTSVRGVHGIKVRN